MNYGLTIIIMLFVLIGVPYIGSVIIGKIMQKRQTTSKLDEILFEHNRED